MLKMNRGAVRKKVVVSGGSHVRNLSVVAVLVAFGAFLYFIYLAHRDEVMDALRVHNVLEISWRVAMYDYTNKTVPAALSELEEKTYGRTPIDPVTGVPYEYYRHGPHTYEICAVFSRAAEDDAGRINVVSYGDPVVHGYGTWSHGSGRQCLTRSIPPWRHSQ